MMDPDQQHHTVMVSQAQMTGKASPYICKENQMAAHLPLSLTLKNY
ncbi:MAG: hypothetical protein AB1424_09460 [Thermodesulfobacteriota bacterium]